MTRGASNSIHITICSTYKEGYNAGEESKNQNSEAGLVYIDNIFGNLITNGEENIMNIFKLENVLID